MESQLSLPEIEIVVTELPSRGKPYPKNAKIFYNTYTFGEVKRFSVSNMSISNSLKRAIEGMHCSFGAENLTVIDALYIGLLRKVSTVGKINFVIPYTCNECGNVSAARFSENGIEFTDLNSEVTELPIVAKINEKELHFSPMTVQQFLDLHSGKFDKILKNGIIDQTAMYALLVQNLSFEESYKVLYNLKNAEDIELIEDIDKILLHEIKSIKTNCRHVENGNVCGAINYVALEGREALIAPFREGSGTTRSRIRFGVTSGPECSPN